MEKTTCGEPEALVEYLYGEIDADTRTRLDTHLVSCAECRETLDGLRGTRAELAAWSVPERPLGFALVGADTGRPGARPWWSSGALAAAAVILLAVAAAIANLEITYGSGGVTLRTGWSRTPEGQTAAPRATSVPAGAPAREATPVSAGAAPWRADLGELERRLRTEFRSAAAPSSARAASPGPDAARLLQQVQDLIEQSELRQRRELALRMAQVVRDFDTQRQTDLVRIQQGIGQIEGNTAADRQLLNYLVRASQRQ